MHAMDASASECRTPETRERTTTSSLKLSGRIVRKYNRLRARPSPLKDTVRRRLLAKLRSRSEISGKFYAALDLYNYSSCIQVQVKY